MLSKNYLVIFITLICIFVSSISYAVTPDQFESIIELLDNDQYDSAFSKINTINKDDPEYYTLSLNYYFFKSSREYLEIKNEPLDQNEPAIVLEDSTGEFAGYMTSTSTYDLDTLQLGIDKINEGISKYPNRLDMHFGLVHVYESVDKYSEMAECLTNILELKNRYDSSWLWTYSEPLPYYDYDFILENVQSRIANLIDYNLPEYNRLVKRLSQTLIEYYPNSTYGYTNLGLLMISDGSFEKGNEYLLKAYAIDSTDIIVLANLAHLNVQIKNTEEAKIYYNMIIEIGTTDEQAYAREMLKALE